jgi:hypothetical protein
LDVAARLRRRGHQPIAYSTLLGDVAAELRSSAVPVIDDLRKLAEPPDVIHGQHIFDAAAACLRFPQTPAVYACHGWEPWQETPLILASIRRYVAVSELTREHVLTSGVPSARIAIIPNFVDLERFPNRRDATARVKKALVYGNAWSAEHPAFLAIREACLRQGFEVEGAGYGFGRPTNRPEALLPAFDVVFAVGRSALEAMACGCAVILAGPQGFAGRVTRESFHRQHAANFGLALLAGRPVTVQAVGEALDGYDAPDVAAVADLVRQEAGADIAVDRWEEQYRLAIADGPAPLADVVADASTCLVTLKTLTSHFERGYGAIAAQAEAERARWMHEHSAADALRAELAAAQPQRGTLEAERDALLARLSAVESHNTALSSWATELHRQVTRLETPIRKRLGRRIRDVVKSRRAPR